jgi:chromate transporter
VLVSALLAYQFGGLLAAIAAPVAFIVPSSLATYVFAHFDRRGGDAPWKAIALQGLAPLTVGLVIASGIVLTQGVGAGPAGYAVTLVVAIASAFTRVHPLLLIAGGALAGLVM